MKRVKDLMNCSLKQLWPEQDCSLSICFHSLVAKALADTVFSFQQLGT